MKIRVFFSKQEKKLNPSEQQNKKKKNPDFNTNELSHNIKIIAEYKSLN